MDGRAKPVRSLLMDGNSWSVSLATCVGDRKGCCGRPASPTTHDCKTVLPEPVRRSGWVRYRFGDKFL